MDPIIIAIPSRFDDHLGPLLKSIKETVPYKIVVLNDGLKNPPQGAIKCPRPFIFSRNINMVLKRYKNHDVMILNDDTIVETPNAFKVLQDVAYKHGIGILSPKIRGHSRNPWQTTKRKLSEEPHKTKYMVAFIAVFLTKAAIARIGLMDERFQYYGWDDDDYCLRARIAGVKIGITNRVIVRHNHGSGSSYKRLFNGGYGPGNSMIFKRKWGYPSADIAINNLATIKVRKLQVYIPV